MSTFFLLKANFFLLGSGKKKLKILFFLFVFGNQEGWRILDSLILFLITAQFYVRGFFLFLLFYFSLRPNHFPFLEVK